MSIKNKEQKIVLLMGRGIEGTGNTRFTIELQDQLIREGHDAKTIANNEKKWGRTQSQVNNIIEHNFKKDGPLEVEDDVNHVIITSVPAKSKAYTQQGKDNFIKTLKEYKEKGAKIVYIQVDHKIHSISRNFYREEEYMLPFFNLLDLIITHDLNNDFNQKFIKRFLPEDYNVPVVARVAIGADMTEFEYLRKPASEKIDKSIMFIGRSAGWKGFQTLRDVQYNHLRFHGYKTIIEGIELSIGVLGDLYTQTKPERIQRPDTIHKFNENDQLEVLKDNSIENPSAYIYGPYNRNEAIERMSNVKFGYFGTFIGAQYGGVLENTLLEIVNAGTIPIIRKELYDSATFNEHRLNDFSPREIGLLVYDSEDPLQLVEDMDFYDDNDEEYDKLFNNAIKFFTKYLDKKVLISQITDVIIKQGE